MSPNYDAYETVVGLEVHAQLLIKSKLFCGDSAAYGAQANTQVSPITLAHPGTLPKMNASAIEMAVKMGLACKSTIVTENYFARKNYFYPDLPKGYQLSQHTTPICHGGYISISVGEAEKRVRLNRIHIEEDAGKSVHNDDADFSSIDLNRAGVALIEIVSEPDISSGEEAHKYLTELRKLVRYLGICDGNMEEGSLRCDANISVRKRNDPQLGTKVEVKNLNSMRNVRRAIEFESQRMIEAIEQGDEIYQQTRSFDADNGTTFPIRDKEDADDYRYFPDPDLSKFYLSGDYIAKIQASIPVLQDRRIKTYLKKYHLSLYDATQLTEERNFSDYFDQIVQDFADPQKQPARSKAAANWMLGPIRSWMNDAGKDIDKFPLPPKKIGDMILMIESGQISFSVASTKLLNELMRQPEKEPRELASDRKWLQDRDSNTIENLIEQVLVKFPDKVDEYKKGKKGLIGLFVGEVMKLSNGAADPRITNEILSKKLNN